MLLARRVAPACRELEDNETECAGARLVSPCRLLLQGHVARGPLRTVWMGRPGEHLAPLLIREPVGHWMLEFVIGEHLSLLRTSYVAKSLVMVPRYLPLNSGSFSILINLIPIKQYFQHDVFVETYLPVEVF